MDAFTQEMQELLLKEREELLKNIKYEGDAMISDSKSANAGRGDSLDLASEYGAYQKMEALSAMDKQRLKSIDSALKRINDGKYGYCLQCGKKIPEGRLRAIPEAVLCVDCKNANERMGWG